MSLSSKISIAISRASAAKSYARSSAGACGVGVIALLPFPGVFISKHRGFSLAGSSVLRIVSPDELSQQEADDASAITAAEDQARRDAQLTSSLISFIDNQFNTFV